VALFIFTQWVIFLRRLKPAATGHPFVLLEESLNLGFLYWEDFTIGECQFVKNTECCLLKGSPRSLFPTMNLYREGRDVA
jgi:hypothetical protein